MKKPELILVDDHELFRNGLKTMLEMGGIANVIGEASNGREFLSLLEKHIPDLVLMDIDMPQLNGIEATRQAVQKFPHIKILVLSMFGELEYYHQMIEAGAKGFLLKNSNKVDLEKAIGKVLNGSSYFSDELLQDLVKSIQAKEPHKNSTEGPKFNEKEIGILKLMCQGYSNEEIAEALFLSAKTVANYRNNLLTKTGCKNSTNLVFYAIKHQIIEI